MGQGTDINGFGQAKRRSFGVIKRTTYNCGGCTSVEAGYSSSSKTDGVFYSPIAVYKGKYDINSQVLIW